MKERLNELIRTFHDKKIVEKIAKSNNKFGTYQKQKKLLKEELDSFRKDVLKYYNLSRVVIVDEEYDILPEDSLQICLICMMIGINDDDLFGNYEDLPIALRQIEGSLSAIAGRISDYLDEAQLFLDYTEKELIKIFFD